MYFTLLFLCIIYEAPAHLRGRCTRVGDPEEGDTFRTHRGHPNGSLDTFGTRRDVVKNTQKTTSS